MKRSYKRILNLKNHELDEKKMVLHQMNLKAQDLINQKNQLIEKLNDSNLSQSHQLKLIGFQYSFFHACFAEIDEIEDQIVQQEKKIQSYKDHMMDFYRDVKVIEKIEENYQKQQQDEKMKNQADVLNDQSICLRFMKNKKSSQY